jgi:prepilin signal peptidase PulO-like enzyme (type II secretory pathway)
MNIKLRNLLIFLYVAGVFSLPGKIYAQITQQNFCQFDFSLGGKTAAGTTGNCADPRVGVTSALDNIIDRLPFYLTGLAFFAFLYSGGMYIFALGDANKQETAKKNMLWTATGMVIMALIGASIRFAGWLATRTTNIPNTTGIPGLTQ